jgi:hypothetical protein
MTLLLNLLLAHFIADYPLQPGWLVAMKQRGIVGVLIHTVIHLVTSMFLVWPWLEDERVWWALGVIFVTHNLIDITKVYLDKKHPSCRLSLYLTDQAAHVTVILLVTWIWLMGVPLPASCWFGGPTDTLLIPFLLVLTLSTYVYDVTVWFWKTRHKIHPYRRGYRTMLRNALIVLLAFGIYWTVGAFVAPAQSLI